MEKNIVERICRLIEEEKIYLNARISEKSFSEMLGVDRKAMRKIMNMGFNMDFKTFMGINRLIYARDMMLLYGVDYHRLWMFSGFRSFSEFSRLCGRVGF